jgi:NAD(P)-dependent dehydrogenase (short-subunit alcohol dehydrogenase family)
VVIHYNTSAAAAEKTRAELEWNGLSVSLVQADLSDPADAEALLERVWDGHGPIDLLVNNASVFPPGTLRDMALDDVVMNLRVNAWAPFTLMRELAGRLEGGDSEGCVINLLDSRIVTGDPHHAAYHLSKLMLAELTRMGALEFAPHLRVNGVAPGPVIPPEDKDEHYLQGLIAALPLRRKGSPEEVADAVVFLATARFVTGQVVFVDGGQHLRPGR